MSGGTSRGPLRVLVADSDDGGKLAVYVERPDGKGFQSIYFNAKSPGGTLGNIDLPIAPYWATQVYP